MMLSQIMYKVSECLLMSRLLLQNHKTCFNLTCIKKK